jgi:hypothetical protein
MDTHFGGLPKCVQKSLPQENKTVKIKIHPKGASRGTRDVRKEKIKNG